MRFKDLPRYSVFRYGKRVLYKTHHTSCPNAIDYITGKKFYIFPSAEIQRVVKKGGIEGGNHPTSSV